MEEKKIREMIGDTIYVTKSLDVDDERLLSIIVGNIERYVYQNHEMPKKLMLSKENYERIKNYNSKAIGIFDDKEYTFGVEIEVKKEGKIFNKFRRKNRWTRL